MNTALKQILTRYSAMELDLEHAEKELRAHFVDENPVVFVELPIAIPLRADVAIREQVLRSTGYRVHLFSNGLNDEEGVAYRPESIDAQVGNFTVKSSTYGWIATVDGKELPPMTHMNIDFVPGELARVRCDFPALPVKETT